MDKQSAIIRAHDDKEGGDKLRIGVIQNKSNKYLVRNWKGQPIKPENWKNAIIVLEIKTGKFIRCTKELQERLLKKGVWELAFEGEDYLLEPTETPEMIAVAPKKEKKTWTRAQVTTLFNDLMDICDPSVENRIKVRQLLERNGLLKKSLVDEVCEVIHKYNGQSIESEAKIVVVSNEIKQKLDEEACRLLGYHGSHLDKIMGVVIKTADQLTKEEAEVGGIIYFLK